MINLIELVDFENRVQLSKKVASEVLNIAIQNAQTLYLKPILGADLFTQMVDNFGTYTVIEQNLYEIIVPYLVFQSALGYFARNGIVDTQSGLRTHSDEFSERLNSDEFRAFMEILRSNIEASRNELISFLNTNIADYPNYKENCKNKTVSTYPFSSVGGARSQRSKWYGDSKESFWGGKE